MFIYFKHLTVYSVNNKIIILPEILSIHLIFNSACPSKSARSDVVRNGGYRFD